MNNLKLTLFFICLFAIIFPGNISGELSKFQYDVIELAFTNGFLRGMSIDEEIVQELLKDKQKLSDFARKEAQGYMDKVVQLNMTEQEKILSVKEEKSKKKKPAKSNNSISF